MDGSSLHRNQKTGRTFIQRTAKADMPRANAYRLLGNTNSDNSRTQEMPVYMKEAQQGDTVHIDGAIANAPGSNAYVVSQDITPAQTSFTQALQTNSYQAATEGSQSTSAAPTEQLIQPQQGQALDRMHNTEPPKSNSNYTNSAVSYGANGKSEVHNHFKATVFLEYSPGQEEIYFHNFLDDLKYELKSRSYKKPKIFICYMLEESQESQYLQKKWLLQLCTYLQRLDMDLFINLANISASTRDRIKNEIENSDKILLVGTPLLKSRIEIREDSFNFEWDLVYEKFNKNSDSIIPIIYKGTYETSFPSAIQKNKVLDFKSDLNYYKHFVSLNSPIGLLASIYNISDSRDCIFYKINHDLFLNHMAIYKSKERKIFASGELNELIFSKEITFDKYCTEIIRQKLKKGFSFGVEVIYKFIRFLSLIGITYIVSTITEGYWKIHLPSLNAEEYVANSLFPEFIARYFLAPHFARSGVEDIPTIVLKIRFLTTVITSSIFIIKDSFKDKKKLWSMTALFNAISYFGYCFIFWYVEQRWKENPFKIQINAIIDPCSLNKEGTTIYSCIGSVFFYVFGQPFIEAATSAIILKLGILYVLIVSFTSEIIAIFENKHESSLDSNQRNEASKKIVRAHLEKKYLAKYNPERKFFNKTNNGFCLSEVINPKTKDKMALTVAWNVRNTFSYDFEIQKTNKTKNTKNTKFIKVFATTQSEVFDANDVTMNSSEYKAMKFYKDRYKIYSVSEVESSKPKIIIYKLEK